MTVSEALDRLLDSYEAYYDVSRCEPAEPFSARAVFHSHAEKYVLLRKARVWEMDSHEYVYFCAADSLDEARVRELAELAWEDGLAQVQAPSTSHRNSDVTLVLVANAITPEAMKAARVLKKTKNYSWGLRGWSSLRTVAYELSGGGLSCNRQGGDLRKLFGKIFQSSGMGVKQ